MEKQDHEKIRAAISSAAEEIDALREVVAHVEKHGIQVRFTSNKKKEQEIHDLISKIPGYDAIIDSFATMIKDQVLSIADGEVDRICTVANNLKDKLK